MRMRVSRTSANLLFTVALASFLFGCSQNPQAPTAPQNAANKEIETAKSASTASAPTEKPDEKSDSKALAAKVLMDPDFIGRDKMCYTIAKEIPQLLQKLFCHCGCDYTEEHSTLLDCYTCRHTIDCNECKGEAMMACKMNRKGASVAEIQKAVDLNWAPKYPFYQQPSDALRKYWKTRLWAPGPGPTAAEKHNEEHKPIDPFTGSQEVAGKTKGSPSGSCCGGSKDVKTAKSSKH